MSNEIKNKITPVALITGGSSPIGKAISLKLAARGMRLILQYHQSVSRTKGFIKELENSGCEIIGVRADLRKPVQSTGVIKKTVEKWGRLDLLVNNASVFKPTLSKDFLIKDWTETLNVNLISPAFLCSMAGNYLKKTKGCIINMVDIYGESPILNNFSAYCVSKSALISFTKYMAMELSPKVRVNGIAPGIISFPTSYSPARKRKLMERTLLKRPGSPEDIANTVIFLASDHYMTGQILRVDGGRFI